MRIAEAEEPAAGKHFVTGHASVAHRHDGLAVWRHGSLRHQLVELNKGKGPVARVILNRLRTAFGTLLHDSEYNLSELNEVAVVDRAWLLDSHAVHGCPVRASQIAEQQATFDYRQLGMLARHGWAGNAERRFWLATHGEPRRADAHVAQGLIISQLTAEQPCHALCG